MKGIFTTSCFFIFSFCFGQITNPVRPVLTQPHTTDIINDYTSVLAFDPCVNKLICDQPYLFFPGDTVLIIQMKGAIADSSNSNSFGNIIDYGNAGNYEFNYIKSVSGDSIELRNNLTRKYDIPNGIVQLVRVPSFQNLTNFDAYTALAWDGKMGGVFALIVNDTLELGQDISAAFKGFRAGANTVIVPNNGACNENNYYYDSATALAGPKAEGIAASGLDKRNGRGAMANGGGGGNGFNSGGGGGGNGSLGGNGGNQMNTCGSAVFANGGKGGIPLNYSNASNKLFMGGGGGAGHMDSIAPFFFSSGGAGGGIVIIKAKYLLAKSFVINSDGLYSQYCYFCGNDGIGGGGAGGTVLMDIDNYIDSVSISIAGAKGGDNISTIGPSQKAGPGGGGSGGIVWFKGNVPSTARIVKNGGVAGVIIYNANNPWGATDGDDGIVLSNLSTIFDTVPFLHNIDSLGLNINGNCRSYNFNGLVYQHTFPILKWGWDFGDGSFDNVQNTSHVYQTDGNFKVILSVTDSYGCTEQDSMNIISSNFQINAGQRDTICPGASIVLTATNTGGTQFNWTPAQFLNNNTILNPTANPPVTTTFYLSANNGIGCTKADSALIVLHELAARTITAPVSICQNDSVRLSATGGNIYLWSPGNVSTSNFIAYPAGTTDYTVQITDSYCNFTSSLNTTVTVLPLPDVKATKSNDIDCFYGSTQLNATGASQYLWSPASFIDNASIANPVAMPNGETLFTVQGIDGNGCVNDDKVVVKVASYNKSMYLMPSAFTPNNDGINDCYGIKGWGLVEELDFSIYNRWGQKVFHTTKPGKCWDGYYKGQQQSPDVYVFFINAKTLCGPMSKKGSFTLIR